MQTSSGGGGGKKAAPKKPGGFDALTPLPGTAFKGVPKAPKSSGQKSHGPNSLDQMNGFIKKHVSNKPLPGMAGTNPSDLTSRGKVVSVKSPNHQAAKAALRPSRSPGSGSSGRGGSGSGGNYSGVGSGSSGKSAKVHTTPLPNLAKTLASATQNSSVPGNLSSYIKTATKDLGPGTDYSKLTKQITGDSKTADTKIGQMYQALTMGIRGDDPLINSIYSDAAKSTAAAGAQAQSTVKNAYDTAAGSVAQRVKATGAAADPVTAQWAAADEANNQASMAANQQTDLTTNAAHGANARQANVERAQASGFTGNETRAGVAQSLSDNVAKLQTQQSTEAAARRGSALQYAIQLQGADRSSRLAQQQMAIDAANTQFSQQLAAGNQAFNQSQGLVGNSLAQQKLQETAAKDALAGQNSAGKNAVAGTKISAGLAGAAKQRQAAALAAQYARRDITYAQYQSQLNKLG